MSRSSAVQKSIEASACALAMAAALCAQAAPKLIFHGWDTLDASPAEMLANADAIAKCGSDGFSFIVKTKNQNGEAINSCYLMNGARWRWEDVAGFKPQIRELVKKPGLEWSMLHFWGQPRPRLALTDDAAWELAANNLAVLARLAREGGLKGLVLDAEDYFKSRQYFWDPEKDPPWEESVRLMRRRGAQFFGGAFKAFPDMDLLSFFFFALDSDYGKCEADPRVTMVRKKDLWPAFLNGMLDVLPPTARICDGDENAYHYQAARCDFAKAASRQMTGVLPLIAPSNRAKYRAQNMVGYGFYVDGYAAATNSPWYLPEVNGSRVAALDANLRSAVKSSDGYIWIYGERHPFIEWKQPPIVRAMSRWKGRRTWEEPLPGFRNVLDANTKPLEYVARRRAEMKADGTYTNLVEGLKPGKNGHVSKFLPARTPGDWYALSFDMKGFGRGLVSWMGRRGWMWEHSDFATFSSPNADGVRRGVIIARVPPDAGQIYICLDGNTDARKNVEFSNFELLLVDHIAAGSVSRYNVKKE